VSNDHFILKETMCNVSIPSRHLNGGGRRFVDFHVQILKSSVQTISDHSRLVWVSQSIQARPHASPPNFLSVAEFASWSFVRVSKIPGFFLSPPHSKIFDMVLSIRQKRTSAFYSDAWLGETGLIFKPFKSISNRH
jgi:hypothetical protein